jgi:hypothetical protein
MSTSIAESPGTGAYASTQSFVINLCSSTSPMALVHPSSPELKRYTFFVSRQRQDGRDRFRLHMGYFDSQDQAEELLNAVRDVYPAAWAGPAPTQGVARRARATPAQSVPAAPAPAAAPTPEPAIADTGFAVVADKVVAGEPALPQTGAPGSSLEQTMSDMRDVLAKLDPEPAPIPRKVLASPGPPVIQPTRPVVQPTTPVQQPPALVVDPPRLQPVTQPRVAAEQLVTPRVALTPEQTLTLLESASSEGGGEGGQKVRVLTPEDTQTLTDIKLDKANNAPPSFAVQLMWSVTPIDASSMPHLAIFDAYTLYNVGGNRQGRKWYGLRLGFFTDPNSATQVANYVRGDYRSVAVVPVSTREMDRARGGSPASPGDSAINPPLKPTEQLSSSSETMSGFELVVDDRPRPPKRDLGAPPQVPTVKAVTRPQAREATRPPARTGKPTGKRAVSRKKPERSVKVAPGAADVLESTLEILGASTLTIDDSKALVIDKAGARSAAARKPPNSKFSRLLNRLGGG